MHANRLKQALLAVLPAVYHHQAPKGAQRYIVWSETGQGADVWGDDALAGQALRYDVTLYTAEEYDCAVAEVQKSLAQEDISFYMAGAGYLETLSLAFVTWVCEVEYGPV